MIQCNVSPFIDLYPPQTPVKTLDGVFSCGSSRWDYSVQLGRSNKRIGTQNINLDLRV